LSIQNVFARQKLLFTVAGPLKNTPWLLALSSLLVTCRSEWFAQTTAHAADRWCEQLYMKSTSHVSFALQDRLTVNVRMAMNVTFGGSDTWDDVRLLTVQLGTGW